MRHRGRSRSRIIHYYNRVFNNQPEFLNLDISGKFALLLSFAPLLLAPCLASTTSLLLLGGRAAGRCLLLRPGGLAPPAACCWCLLAGRRCSCFSCCSSVQCVATVMMIMILYNKQQEFLATVRTSYSSYALYSTVQ